MFKTFKPFNTGPSFKTFELVPDVSLVSSR